MTEIIRNCAMDSTRWQAIRHRPGDIVIGAWGKSGTTWTQQIVGQLIFEGAADIAVDELAPWIESAPRRGRGGSFWTGSMAVSRSGHTGRTFDPGGTCGIGRTSC